MQTPDVLDGGGEMGALLRSMRWDSTPVGPIDGWPQSLKTALSILLSQRTPVFIFWGPEHIQFYNDAYRPILGTAKHPAAMGQRAAECWPEIWSIIEPLVNEVHAGSSTGVEDGLLLLNRHGYLEEGYYTYTFSPIRDEAGGVGGVFCIVYDTTARVVGERRLRTLRDLAARLRALRSPDEICQAAAEILAANPQDIPFAALYVSESEASARLAATAGVPAGTPITPARVRQGEGSRLAQVMASRATALDDLEAHFGAVPTGAWQVPPSSAVALPLTLPGQDLPAGHLVAAVNPHKRLDADYRTFLELVAGQIAGAMAEGAAYEHERRRAEALAELDRAKTTFFSNVSHELRTPLTLILAPIQDLMEGGQLPPEARAELAIVQRNGARLETLVNALLDFARIEAGRMDACYVPTDLAALTRDLASTFESAMQRAGLAYEVACEPLDQPVYVDRSMWERIVLNLISNAFKYTKAGSVTVRLGRDGASAVLSVADTGIGIPQAEQAAVFERFRRGAGTQARSAEGSGIGLALAQELTRLHGGRIDVASVPGQGSTFTVRLSLGCDHLPADRIGAPPLDPPAVPRTFVQQALGWFPPADPAPLPADASADARPLAIVADDNHDMRDYVARLLAGACRVIAVPDGAAALDAARSHDADLVVSDVMMPVTDGFTLLASLRASARTIDVPVILLSARAGEEARLDGLRAGADDYLVKPFTARELVARASSLIGAYRARRAAALRERELSAAAHEQGAWLRQVLDLAPVAIELIEPETARVTFTNRAAAALLPAVPADVRADLHRRVGAGAGLDAVETVWTDDDGPRWMLTHGQLLPAMHGHPATGVLVSQDTTAVKKVEEELRHTQKLQAIGKLAGGIAHEYNNLLTVVIGNAALLLETEADPERRAMAEEVSAAASRAAVLTSQLLAFGRKQMLRPELVSLNDVVRRAQALLRPMLEGVRVELALVEPLDLIRCDPAHLEQVVVNLALNGKDAMTSGGTLTIRTANVPGSAVMLGVTDTGHGMAPEVLARIFEPFFTTKPVGKGTGLGLSMCEGIVTQSGGRIEVDTSAARGSTFRLLFPRAQAAGQPAAPQLPGNHAPPAGATVLVVEDDIQVLRIAVSALSQDGYRVLSATGPDEALGHFLGRSGAIDLVVSDVVMPRMSGPELIARARQLHPGLLALYMSGYPEDHAAQAGLSGLEGSYLPKPFTPGILRAKVRELLSGRVTQPGQSA